MSGPIEVRLHFDEFKSPTILAKQIEDIEFNIKSFRAPLVSATRELAKDIEHQFSVGGDPAWAPLNSSTVKRKKDTGSILVRSGKLKRRASQYARWSIDKESASYSLPNSVSYGYFHQTGFKHYTNNGPEDVPARPFVRLDAKQQRIIVKAFDSWFDDRLTRLNK